MEVTNSHELAVSPSTKWGRAGQRTRVLLSKPRRMNETQQHQAAGTQRGALRTSASVTWSQGFPEKVTWDQGSAGGPGAGGGRRNCTGLRQRRHGRSRKARTGNTGSVGRSPSLSRGRTIRYQGSSRKGGNIRQR